LEKDSEYRALEKNVMKNPLKVDTKMSAAELTEVDRHKTYDMDHKSCDSGTPLTDESFAEEEKNHQSWQTKSNLKQSSESPPKKKQSLNFEIKR